jgi:hypothetical protein
MSFTLNAKIQMFKSFVAQTIYLIKNQFLSLD